jgi:hypothetical protein
VDRSCPVSKELPSVQDITAAHDALMSYAMVQQPIPNPSTGTDIEKLTTALAQAIQTSTSIMQNEQNQQHIGELYIIALINRLMFLSLLLQAKVE